MWDCCLNAVHENACFWVKRKKLWMSATLPLFDSSVETNEDVALISSCLLEPCSAFIRGCCALHRPLACFHFHHPKQRRRPVLELNGRLKYWDHLCQRMDSHGNCPFGDSCIFAHSKLEISYHPARFRIKICNGVECRGAVCCFAHSFETIRFDAPSKYGYLNDETKSSLIIAPEGGCRSDSDSTVTSDSVMNDSKIFSVRRFCECYPNFWRCNQGDKCFFAHSVDELDMDLVNTSAVEFYPFEFKKLWCPFSHQHDWNRCPYAHNWQDSRRSPMIGYGPAPCPYWDRSDPKGDYCERCPRGLRCPFAHGRKEQLYHPVFYKTQECCDWRRNLIEGDLCPRGEVCAFAHGESELRAEPRIQFDYFTLLDEATVAQACAHQLSQPNLVAVVRSQTSHEDIDMREFLRFIYESS